MIILHPDGTYEVCSLPPLAARWLRAFVRRRSAEVCAEGADGAMGKVAVCGEPCQEHNGAVCGSN